LCGAAVVFARTPEELRSELAAAPDLVLLDLTTVGWDHGALLATVEARAPRVPVLGFTTHALARQTAPLHARCERVVTRETLARELPRFLTAGVAGARGDAEDARLA